MTELQIQEESLRLQKWAFALQIIGLATTLALIYFTRDDDDGL